MWPSIRRWRDWAVNDLLQRTGLRPPSLYFSYDKAGLRLHDPAVPWNAESVQIETLVRVGPGCSKADFQLVLGGRDLHLADDLRTEEAGLHRLAFHLPAPAQTVDALVQWRNRTLGELTIPVLSRQEFIDQLKLQMPTLSVRIGHQNIACTTFVASQCKGLVATALLMGNTSLVPLLDLGLEIEIRSERTGSVHTVPVKLASSQLAARQALVSVILPRWPRHTGSWLLTWQAGGQPLAVQRVKAVSQRHFERSLRLVDARFLVLTPRPNPPPQGGREPVPLRVKETEFSSSVRRQISPLQASDRFGPLFILVSREPGMAGLCSLEVRIQAAGAGRQPLGEPQEVLVSDGPTLFAPGTVTWNDREQVTSFELRLKKDVLGVLSLSPAPTARFSSEGGFKPLEEYVWTPAAEEELNERLANLLKGPEQPT